MLCLTLEGRVFSAHERHKALEQQFIGIAQTFMHRLTIVGDRLWDCLVPHVKTEFV